MIQLENTIQITKEELKIISDTLKSLKTTVAVLYPNGMVLGTDIDSVSCIKHTTCPILGLEIVVVISDWNAFLRTNTFPNGAIIGPGYVEEPDTKNRYIPFPFNQYELLTKFSNICIELDIDRRLGRFIHIDVDPDTTNRLYEMKNPDGMAMFNFADHIMALFNGILPLNKGDTLSLDIGDDEYNYSFLARFIIHKKKKEIVVLLRYLKIT